MLAVSMVFWIILVLTVLVFCYPLIKSKQVASGRVALFWLTCALIFGVTGTCLVSLYSTIQIVLTKECHSLLFLGRGFLLQAMFLSGFIAVISSAVKNSSNITSFRPGIAVNSISLVLIILSFPCEFWVNDRLGFAVRAVAVLFTFGNRTALRKIPDEFSTIQWTIWLSAWMIPIGYLIPMFDPGLRGAGLHVVFICGFTLGFLSMVLNQIQKILDALVHPDVLKVFVITLFASTLLRYAAETGSTNQTFLLSISATVFTLGILLWLIAVFSALLPHRS
jgi:hypothetical protein